MGLDAQLKEVETGFLICSRSAPVPNDDHGSRFRQELARFRFNRAMSGRVTEVVGSLVESSGPFRSGSAIRAKSLIPRGEISRGEIVAFRGAQSPSTCSEKPTAFCFGDRVVTCGARPSLRVGPKMLGRVIDAKGTPRDTLGEYPAVRALPVDVLAPAALDRTIIDEPLGCGIRAIDGF